jgi:3-oxoacyl-[acyl-carrier protein] reductase
MDLGLSNKVAWVLGGSSGLGRASAESLAHERAAVAISSRDPERIEKAAAEISAATGSRVLGIAADVRDAVALSSAHTRITVELGDVDILIGNAGGPTPGPFESFDDNALYEAFTLTTASARRLAHLVTPAMVRGGSGTILFLTSASTKEVAEGLLLSNMMRAAVVGLAKTMSKEYGPRGLRVLCVAPGRIATDRLVQLDAITAERTGKTPQEVAESWAQRIPLGRYGGPREFGDVVAFMASERASYVTGTSVLVDGGMLSSTHA